MKREKTRATAIEVPQSRERAAAAIAAIGEHQRARQTIEAAMNARLARTRARYEALAQIRAKSIEALTKGLEIWAAAHRDELTDEGRTKTARLATGELKWRMTPPAVKVKGMADALAALLEAGLLRFVRTRSEIDREAILKDPEGVAAIPGISIGQHEEFVIVPFETKLEEIA